MRPAVPKLRAGITLAVVEVEVLCRLLNLALPHGIAAGLSSHEVWSAVLAALAARGLVCSTVEGGFDVHPAIAGTLRLAAACRVAVGTELGGGDTLMATSDDPDAPGIVMRPGAPGVVRMEPIERCSELCGVSRAAQDCGSMRSQIASTPAASISGPAPANAAAMAPPSASSSATSSASMSSSPSARESTSTSAGSRRGG